MGKYRNIILTIDQLKEQVENNREKEAILTTIDRLFTYLKNNIEEEQKEILQQKKNIKDDINLYDYITEYKNIIKMED